MTANESQIAYFMKFMKTKEERHCWDQHFLHRAEVLEKEFRCYAGLRDQLRAALFAQRAQGK